VNLYAESSAVLSWLFGEPKASDVRRHLTRADLVLTSDLTLVECERAIIRAEALDGISPRRASSCRSRLLEAAAGWNVLRIAADVTVRARQRFPNEPLRALDALHLASAELGRSAVLDLKMLSLDKRIRTAAAAMEFEIVPK
jgi:predicted nucleic acid-binding protein